MRRALALAISLLAASAAVGGGPPVSAAALSTGNVVCPHLHLTYSSGMFSGGGSVSVSGSICTIDGVASTNIFGGGSVTLLGSGANPACVGIVVECASFALSLSTGATSESPAFLAVGPAYYDYISAGPDPIPPGLFDFGAEGTIIGTGSGSGSGALNSICTFAGGTESCTADGSLVWEGAAGA